MLERSSFFHNIHLSNSRANLPQKSLFKKTCATSKTWNQIKEAYSSNPASGLNSVSRT
jgi:hypothetical protein